MNQPKNAVVVAVGLDSVDAALEFAAEEALLAQAPVHLLHVLRIPAVDAYAGAYGGVLEDANGALAAALDKTRQLTGDRVPVSSERVDDGTLINRLVRHADDGRMIVLQHRRLGRGRRLITGSTVNGVAARAAVPVASVAEGWTKREQPALVTVGVQDMHEVEGLLRTAYTEAALRDAALSVLHAWWLNSGFDSVVVDQPYREQRETEAREQLQPAVDALRGEFRGVEAGLVVRHAPPAEALLDAAMASDVLVLGRRYHLLPPGSHLGPAVRSLIDHSDCPVLLAPEERSDVSPGIRSRVSGVMH